MKRALILLAIPAVAGLSRTSVAQFTSTPTASTATKPSTPVPIPPYESLLANLNARSIGPTTMGGRVTDIAVYEKEPRIFFVGAASGGVWKTENGGITFAPIFQKEGSSDIGAVAVSQSDPNLIWVGTGESTSRNSAGWGVGIYKTTDGGKTWKNMGLPNSYHFSHILIDPRNSDVVYAGVLGGLWGFNPDRGVYKTTDGGKTWKKVFFVDDRTGVGDIVMDPSNNKTLLVGMWERERFPYNFISGGHGSGMYKSTDGSATWRHITKGLPTSLLGRIGLNYFRKNPRIVIATVEAKEGGMFRSTDGGESWTKTSSLDPRPFYFSVPRQDPNDITRIYVPAVSLHYSEDTGKTFRAMRSSAHVDHHAMWIDPADSNHMLIGEDGGTAQTRDRGATWEHLNYMAIGQYYAVTYDMRKPYWVYGGLQDNGSWAGPTQTTRGGVAFFDFYNIGGGDGFHAQVDPEDWTTVYSESQGGAMSRIDQKYGGGRYVQPRAPRGEKYRFNWSTPFILSPFNSHTIYFGGNRLFKSVDRGDHWLPVSPDLSYNEPDKQKPGAGSVSPEDTGAEAYGTIITIAESPMKQGELWVGTDDGKVQMTTDDGQHWNDLTAKIPGLPKYTWTSRVTPSRFVDGRAYATFDGHRNQDFATYVYKTEDFGKTWTKLNANLPTIEPCYVIKEGLANPDLLFLGTEYSLWVSFDRGEHWIRYRTGDWPTVPVHDFEIHPRDKDLIIATHGRSLWTLPVGALDELTQDNLKKDVYFAKPTTIYLFGRTDQGQEWDGDRIWVSPNNQPGTLFTYYLRKATVGDAKITITDPSGENEIGSTTGGHEAGLNTVTWSAQNRNRLVAGDYRVELNIGGKNYYSTLHVEEVTDQMNTSVPRIRVEGEEVQQNERDKEVEEEREQEEAANKHNGH
jgi:photosystem II stability/assembly factor-like uncharacterized protein